MRLNTRTFIGLIIALAVAVALVWKLNRDSRSERAANVRPPAAPAIPLTLTNLPAAAAAVPAPLAVSSRFAVVATNPPNAPFTNALAYRLTNSQMSFTQLLRSDFGVLLRNALIDTRLGAPAIPAHLRAAGNPGAYIVQARGVITDEFRDELRQAGAEIVSYVPNNAYLVRASWTAARALRGSPLTQSVLPFEPYYKLDARLLALAVNQQPSPHPLVNVVTYPNGARAAQAALEQIGAQVVGTAEPTVFGDVLVVKAGAEQLAELARVDEVQMVGVRYEKRILNDLTRPLLRISTNIPFSTNVAIVKPPDNYYSNDVTLKNLTGEGVFLAVSDSGVDDTHPDLVGRVFGSGTDADGHGTHVVGILLGDGTQSPLGNRAARGSLTNAVFSGMAPRAKAFVQDFQLPDTLQQRNNALTNALISNNSWGRPGANDYDIFAASFDAAVRDSLPGAVGEQQLTYVFAAGNEGGGGGNGLNGIPGSIISPATAKNVITVGANDLPRFITNFVSRACVTDTNTGITTCETNQPWYGMTDTNNQVSPYSSRGNVGIGLEGINGRFKPDVVAPGSMLVSTRSKEYVDPVGSVSTFPFVFNNVTVAFNRTNLYALTIPPNAISVTIATLTNILSPTNLTLDVAAAMDTPPPPGLIATNGLALTPPTLTAGTLYYTVANRFHTNQTVYFDLAVVLTVTNDVGDYFTVLQELNAPLKVGNQGYRYEAGTSMAAPAISGFLALIQEFLGTNGSRPSPALLKAMLINGARSLSPNYNVQVGSAINHQGWGLANMSNSLPSGFSRNGTNGPMKVYDQSLTNALVTGDMESYEVAVPVSARSFPLRVTLVWTDPPGNPVTGVKLVNDMNLTVFANINVLSNGVGTNSIGTNSAVWIGNNFGPGANFVEPLFSGTTVNSNFAPNVTSAADVELARDFVNNVENIFIRPPLAASYTVQVKGHRVNVNAVNSHTNRHAQDYALVISSGNVVASNNVNLTITRSAITNDLNLRRFAEMIPAPLKTNGALASQSAGLLNQRVGANNPLIVSTNGATNQWCFFTYTNVNDPTFTNVVILTFLPPNLSLSRYRDGDIDLYVAGSSHVPNAFNLTNRDDSVIAASLRSVGRSGTEYVYLENAAAGEVFYIGVKSEDQQAANFAIYAESRNGPFSTRDASNNIIASAVGPFLIPDGTPDNPGGTNALVFVLNPLDLQAIVQRVWLTNAIYHEEAGDLIGILSRPGGTNAVALNNHRTWNGWENPVFPFGVVYDDSGQGDLGDETDTPPVLYPDGPGRLLDYLGEQAGPVWNLTVSDNSLFHTGFLNDVTVVIEPGVTNGGDSDVILDQRICVRSGTWLYRAINIPSDAYNVELCVSEFERAITVPLEIYVRWGGFPDFTTYDHFFSALPPGDCFNIGLGDNPPLTTGRYIIGFYNRDAQDVCLRVRATLSRKAFPGPYALYKSTDTPKSLFDRDDATTNSVIFVPDYGRISDLRVGLRVDHARASDLAFHLTSPSGTRLLLMENRGRTNNAGIGASFTNIVTNVVRTLVRDGFDLAPTNSPFFCGGNWPVGSVFSGWTVDFGNVDVIHDWPCQLGLMTASHSLSNGVDMNGTSRGGIFTNITGTVPGRDYLFTFAYARHPIFSSATVDVTFGTNVFTVTDSRTTYNTYPALTWLQTSIVVRASSNLTPVKFRSVSPVGNGAMYIDTVQVDEVDIHTNENIYLTFTENTNLTTTPIKFGIPPYTNGAYVTTNQLIYSNSFASAVGPEWSPSTRSVTSNGSNYLGKFYNSTCTFNWNGIQPTHSAIEVSFDLYILNSWDGWTNNGPDIWTWKNNGTNVIRTTFSNFPRVPNDGHQNYPSNYPFGDFEGQTGADEVNKLGIVPSALYRMKRIFPHTGGPIQMSFIAEGLSLIPADDEYWGIANFKISALNNFSTEGDSFYLPEEPITPFFGEQAHGAWNLEVWDSRLGAASPTNTLVSWKLEIAYPQTNPPVYFLTNGISHTNFVLGPNPVYFAVDVPCEQGFTSNTLRALTVGSGLNLVFNQYVLPTNGPLDVLLLTNVLVPPQTRVLVNGQTPLTDPVRYYLAVYNVNPGETNQFALTVSFDCGPGPIRLTNELTICGVTNAPGQFRRFDYISATNAVALQFEVFNIANANVDLYERQTFNPHPAPGLFQFAGTNPGTASEFIFVTTNSRPPLIPAVWNLAVTNLGGVTANYCIRVREIYDTNAPVLSPGHAPTNHTVNPNGTDYYLVEVNSNLCFVTLSLANHTNGNLNVFTVFRGPRPDYVTNSLAPGNPPNVAVLAVSNLYNPGPNSNSIWVVAVQNTNGVPVSYDFRASGILCTPFAPIIRVGYSSYTSNGLWLEWDAPRTEVYQVQFTTNLNPVITWSNIPPPAVSYDGLFLFLDPGATNDTQRFYRLLRVP